MGFFRGYTFIAVRAKFWIVNVVLFLSFLLLLSTNISFSQEITLNDYTVSYSINGSWVYGITPESSNKFDYYGSYLLQERALK